MSARRGSTRVGRKAAVGTLLAALAALALSAPAEAVEVPNHPFKGVLVGGKLLEDPCGAAVTPQGDIYVSDYYHDSIGVWGHVLGNFGTLIANVAPSNGPCGLALDPDGNLYVNYWHGAVVRYAAPGYETATVIDSAAATGIAVDPSSGDLYVNERTSIAVYEAPVEPNHVSQRIGAGTLLDGYGLAVSSFLGTDGQVYAADAATGTVKVYDPASDPIDPVRVIDGAGTSPGRFVSLVDSSLATDQSNGHLFVADNTQPGFEHPRAVVDEFNADGLYRGQLEHVLVDGEPVGIAVDESSTPRKGQVYVTTGNGQSDVLGGFDPEQASSLLVFGPAGAGQTLAAARSGAGVGTVKSSPPGIACGSACKAEFDSGGLVTLTAAPAAGSAFAGWSGSCSGTGSCQVTLNAAASVSAEFIPAPALLGAASGTGKSGSGAVDPSATALVLGRPIALGAAGVSLRVTAPVPGTLVATANGLKRATARLARAGSIILRLHLSPAGRRALAGRKTGRLDLRVSLSFEPSYGGAASVIAKTVTFKHIGREKR